MTIFDLTKPEVFDYLEEGYKIVLTRNDGYEYIIGMEYRAGEGGEIYTYQFGRNIKREFEDLDTILNMLYRFEFTKVEYKYPRVI